MGLSEFSKSGVSLDKKPHFRNRERSAEGQETGIMVEQRNQSEIPR